MSAGQLGCTLCGPLLASGERKEEAAEAKDDLSAFCKFQYRHYEAPDAQLVKSGARHEDLSGPRETCSSSKQVRTGRPATRR